MQRCSQLGAGRWVSHDFPNYLTRWTPHPLHVHPQEFTLLQGAVSGRRRPQKAWSKRGRSLQPDLSNGYLWDLWVYKMYIRYYMMIYSKKCQPTCKQTGRSTGYHLVYVGTNKHGLSPALGPSPTSRLLLIQDARLTQRAGHGGILHKMQANYQRPASP